MSKLLKVIAGVIGGLLLVVILALIIVPTFFSDEVESFAKKMANQYVKNATVDFGDFSLSIFSSFPDLRAGIGNVNIIGQGRFEGDTLLHVGKLFADVDVMKAISGDIQINAVSLDDVLAQGIITADSLANWDIINIAADSTTTTADSDTTSSAPLKLSLQEVTLSNVRLAYLDSTSNTSASIAGLNASMNGNMNGNVMALNLNLAINAINAALSGISYVNNTALNFNADAVADLDSMKFTFNDNSLTFGGLPLRFDGWAQLKDSSVIALDMRLAAIQTTFESILNLLPEDILKSVDGLKTTGSFDLYAMAKGEYRDMDHIPALDAALKVNNGYVKYPDLPESLSDINISVLVNNPGGSADLTTVAIDTFHFALAGNPFDIRANVKTPISNVSFDALALGKVDLTKLKSALPLDDMELSGIIDANLKVAADLASIDNQQYDKVIANGKVGLSKFIFKGSALPQGLEVTDALLSFSPKAVTLDPLNVLIGKSDINLKGNVENYLPYLLKDDVIRGTVSVNSNLLDCNELLAMTSSTSSTDTTSTQTTTSNTQSEPLQLPTNIDFHFTTDIDKLLYDRLELTNINGRIALANGVADLSNLSTDLCDGKLVLNGKFQTPKSKNSKADMNVDFNNVNINKLTNSFSVIDSLLPIAHNAYGNVTIGLDITTEIDAALSPILKSVNGKGNFASANLQLKDSDFQNNLSKLLSNDKYNDLQLKDTKFNYTIKDGNIVVEPFKVNVFGRKADFSGKQGLDQSMDYTLKLPIARSEIATLISKTGATASSFSSGDDLPVGIQITGKLTKPNLKLDLSEATKTLASEAANKAKDKVTNAADKAIDNIKDEKTKEKVNQAKDALNNLFKKKK